jgi:hypothetical protein
MSVHRTLVEALVQLGHPEYAAIVIDCELQLEVSKSGGYEFFVEMPVALLANVENDPAFARVVTETCRKIMRGHLLDQNDAHLDVSTIPVSFRAKHLELAENWKAQTRRLILEAAEANQGALTKKAFELAGRSPIVYNEMTLSSQAEVRLAQEFENRRVLFFPRPLAVRADTGERFVDHQEPDFVVCHDGKWGILEVSHSSPEASQIADEKGDWLMRSGMRTVLHFPADRCYIEPGVVVDEFLTALAASTL